MATYNEKAWAFVRKAKTPYTAWDLARIAQVSYNFARLYILYLNRAGYIKVVGRKGKERLYRTVKITGVKPVKVNHHNRTLIDENTGKVYRIQRTKRSETLQSIWDEILALKEFSSLDIYEKTYINKNVIRQYLRFLKKAGYIKELDKNGKLIRYKLIKHQKDYPETNKDVQSIRIDKQSFKEKQSSIWKLITSLPSFTVKDLSQKLPNIHPESIRTYIKHLRRAGYLEIIRKTQYDGFLYRLVRNSGEKAPVLKLSRSKPPVVYDPNKNKTYLSIGD